MMLFFIFDAYMLHRYINSTHLKKILYIYIYIYNLNNSKKYFFVADIQ